MGANKRTPENAKIANAILQALFRQDGQTVQQVRDEINAESDEYQTVNGVLTSLQKREEITRVNGRYFLTPFGRKQVSPPGPVKPAVAALLPAPAPARNVEEPSKENVVTYPLSVLTDLVAQDDAAQAATPPIIVGSDNKPGAVTVGEVLRAAGAMQSDQPFHKHLTPSLADREREHAAEERAAQEALTALRAIEAALPGNPNPPASLSAAAIADRAVALLEGGAELARDRDMTRVERDEAQRLLTEQTDENAELRATLRAANAERDKAVADLDRVNNETLTAYETLEDEDRAEKAAYADAKAEIASLREQLNAANAALAFYRAEPAKPSDADGHYWTEQGGRHVLSVLRPVVLGEMLVAPDSTGWTAGDHYGRVVGDGEKVIDLARKLVEVAAGVAGGGE
jgi:hypothetical protein